MHELLMTVGHTHPHLYVRNGVTYECMKVRPPAALHQALAVLQWVPGWLPMVQCK